MEHAGIFRLVDRIIRGAQKYFRVRQFEESFRSVATRMRGFNTLLFFSPPFLMFLCVFFKEEKKPQVTPFVQFSL